jgi:hypothetical protein
VASHSQKGAIAVDAFQWTAASTIGGIHTANAQSGWIRHLALQVNSDGTLIVPISAGGTQLCRIGDWVVYHPDGVVDVVAASTFTALYS